MNPAAPATHAVPLRAHLRYLGPHAGTTPIDITLVLRRAHRMIPAVPAWPARPLLTRGDFARQCGSDPADLERLRAFARNAGLTETGADPGRRVLHLRASPQALQQAFGVTLGAYACSAGSSAPLDWLRRGPGAATGSDRGPWPGWASRRPDAVPQAARDSASHLHAAAAGCSVQLSGRYRWERSGRRHRRARRRFPGG